MAGLIQGNARLVFLLCFPFSGARFREWRVCIRFAVVVVVAATAVVNLCFRFLVALSSVVFVVVVVVIVTIIGSGRRRARVAGRARVLGMPA
jgi:hypothetical protein